MSKKDFLASFGSVQDHNIGKGEYKLPVTPDTLLLMIHVSYV